MAGVLSTVGVVTGMAAVAGAGILGFKDEQADEKLVPAQVQKWEQTRADLKPSQRHLAGDKPSNGIGDAWFGAGAFALIGAGFGAYSDVAVSQGWSNGMVSGGIAMTLVASGAAYVIGGYIGRN
jgi:hypothetical protein